MADVAPMVLILDALVPQMEDQFADNLNLVDEMDAVRLLDRSISEQVIEVPKFIIDDTPRVPRLLSRRWRNSWRIVEQIVHPVSRGGLHGSSSSQLRQVGAAQGCQLWQALLLEQTHSSVCLEDTA